MDGKIKKLDVQLHRYKEQIKKTRPGPAQEAVKARAMRVLKQKRVYDSYFFHDFISTLRKAWDFIQSSFRVRKW